MGGVTGPRGAVHLAAAWLGCKRAMVGTGWANSHPGCMYRLRKYHFYLVGGSFVSHVYAKSSLKRERNVHGVLPSLLS